MGKQIGKIGNYYGGLQVMEKGGRYYWAIENYNGCSWEEISGKLYYALLEHNEQKSGDKP